jgi:hypothetical protein
MPRSAAPLHGRASRPILFGLALHGRRCRIFHFEPMIGPPGPIRRVAETTAATWRNRADEKVSLQSVESVMLTDYGAALLAEVIAALIAVIAVVLWWRKPWSYPIAVFALFAFLALGVAVMAVVEATT